MDTKAYNTSGPKLGFDVFFLALGGSDHRGIPFKKLRLRRLRKRPLIRYRQAGWFLFFSENWCARVAWWRCRAQWFWHLGPRRPLGRVTPKDVTRYTASCCKRRRREFMLVGHVIKINETLALLLWRLTPRVQTRRRRVSIGTFSYSGGAGSVLGLPV